MTPTQDNEVGTWVPDFCDCSEFYEDLQKAGIWYDRGRADSYYYSREISLKESDIDKFEEVRKVWGA